MTECKSSAGRDHQPGHGEPALEAGDEGDDDPETHAHGTLQLGQAEAAPTTSPEKSDLAFDQNAYHSGFASP